MQNSKKILVSVIVPVKNNQKYLSKCLESITNQTLTNIEIIIINDASTDNSRKIAEKFALNDSRIHIINNIYTKGTGKSRNEGMYVSKGEYIAFMDSDDYYPSNKILEIIYNKAKLNNAYICGGGLNKIDEKNNLILRNIKDQFFKREGWLNYKEYQYDGGFYRFIYKNEIIKKYNILFPCRNKMEDPIFFVKIMLKIKKFYIVKEVVYNYRINHKEEIWTNNDILDKINSLIELMKISKKEKLKKLHYLMAKNYLNFCRNKFIKLEFYKKIKFLIKVLYNINWNYIYEENRKQKVKITKIKLIVNCIFRI